MVTQQTVDLALKQPESPHSRSHGELDKQAKYVLSQHETCIHCQNENIFHPEILKSEYGLSRVKVNWSFGPWQRSFGSKSRVAILIMAMKS